MGQRGDGFDWVPVAHIKGIIGSHHDPSRAHCLDQEVKGRHGVDQGVKAEKSKVIAGRPVNICPSLGPHSPAMFPTTAQVRARATAVGKIEFQAWKLFKYSAEDEARGGYRRVAWITDQVLEVIG